MHRQRIPLGALALLLAAAVAVPNEPEATPHRGLDVSGMDMSVKPYEDFYQFANGRWLARTSIPEDRPSVSLISLLQDRNREVLHGILEETARDSGASKDALAAK